jgi:hypothetical protein
LKLWQGGEDKAEGGDYHKETGQNSNSLNTEIKTETLKL